MLFLTSIESISKNVRWDFCLLGKVTMDLFIELHQIFIRFSIHRKRERERQKISHCYTLMCLYLCLPVCFGRSKFADTKTDSPKRNETERNAFRFDSILNIRSDAVFCSFQCGETEIERMKEGNEQKLSETVR